MKKIIFFVILSLQAQGGSPDMSCKEARTYTNDVGVTLAEIRELDKIQGSCDKFFKAHESKINEDDSSYRKNFVLCGKEMFFLMAKLKTGFGMPEKLALALIDSFPEITGEKFEKLGFLVDSSIKNEKWPLGYVQVKKTNPFSFKSMTSGKVNQISCAGCHVSQLPDNRYAVGAPNQNLDLGTFSALGAFTFWKLDGSKKKSKRWDSNLTHFYEGLDEKLVIRKKKNMVTNVGYIKDLKLQDFFYWAIGEQVVPIANQASYLKGGPGVYNLMSPMFNVPDKEFYVTPPQIWGLNHHKKSNKNGHTLGVLNETSSLEEFIQQAMVLSTYSKKFSKSEIIQPLVTYVACLKTPENPKPKKEDEFISGEKIFKNSCLKCHNGPNGEGYSIHLPEEVNSPQVYHQMLKSLKPQDRQTKYILSLFDKLNIKIRPPQGIPPRRLNGIWAKKLFMTNGSIKGFDHLFCLNGKKRIVLDNKDPLLDGTHLDLCENYNESEKKSLVEYLMHFGKEEL